MRGCRCGAACCIVEGGCFWLVPGHGTCIGDFVLLWVVGDGVEESSCLKVPEEALRWLRAGDNGGMGGGISLSSGDECGEHGIGKSQ